MVEVSYVPYKYEGEMESQETINVELTRNYTIYDSENECSRIHFYPEYNMAFYENSLEICLSESMKDEYNLSDFIPTQKSLVEFARKGRIHYLCVLDSLGFTNRISSLDEYDKSYPLDQLKVEIDGFEVFYDGVRLRIMENSSESPVQEILEEFASTVEVR